MKMQVIDREEKVQRDPDNFVLLEFCTFFSLRRKVGVEVPPLGVFLNQEMLTALPEIFNVRNNARKRYL